MGDLLFGPFILVGRNWLAQLTLNLGVEVFALPDCKRTRRNFAISLTKDFLELSSPKGFSNGLNGFSNGLPLYFFKLFFVLFFVLQIK